MRSIHMPIAALVFFACWQSPIGPLDQLAAAEQPPGAPVVLELFTSQGCSSCPPADKLLRKLAEHPNLSEQVIPMAFHVDYWDHLGWKDPYSSAVWSQRQRDYATALRTGTVYTPQLVVDGEQEEVGSNSSRVVDALGIALKRPKTVAVSLRCGEGTEPGAQAQDAPSTVLVNAELDTSHHGEAMLYGFLVGDEPDTSVPRGENAGRSLPNAFAVLSQAPVASCDGASPNLEDTAGPRLLSAGDRALQLGEETRVTGCLHFQLGDQKRAARQLRLVVLAQDTATLAVRGAAALDLPCGHQGP